MRVQVRNVEFSVEEDEFGPFWRRVVDGCWEPASFGVLDRVLTADSTFVDIGAWIGPLTLYAANLADRCHAVEPDPRARAGLLANVACNPGLADRIQVHSAAVGEAVGQAHMGSITSDVGGDSMSSLLFGTAATSWVVECVTLEGLISGFDIPSLGLVKIDIEGAEVEVLNGSREYVEKTHPPLFLSVHGRFWPDPLPRMRVLLDVLSAYDEILTPSSCPLIVNACWTRIIWAACSNSWRCEGAGLATAGEAIFDLGVIRTSHAGRAVDTADTPARRAELARALGNWAVWYGPGATRRRDQRDQRDRRSPAAALEAAAAGAGCYVTAPTISTCMG